MNVLGERYDPTTRTKPNGSVVQLIERHLTFAEFVGNWSSLEKDVGDHKFSHGHALILSGPPGRGGAARLAARGSLRIGAGLVTLGCPPDAIPENAARVDAVMLRAVADGAGLAEVLGDARINALCVGPGLGTGEAARAVGGGRCLEESGQAPTSRCS